MRILWAVSSVGKGHVMRDIAIVTQLHHLADVEVEWLAPEPAGEFLRARGDTVLDCSSQLTGSGNVYAQVFHHCTDEFNLIEYIRRETPLHHHDFAVSRQAWKTTEYDVVVGDEAFWLLSGFSSHQAAKPAPFVFLTDFIGIKAMRPRIRDMVTAWKMNLGFIMSYAGPDVYVYIGDVEEIPTERFGLLLPRKRQWAQQHCHFVKPIAAFDPDMVRKKKPLRKRLGLPENRRIFLAIIGREGNHEYRMAQIEKTFACLKHEFPEAHFLLVGPEGGSKNWIHYHRYLEKLYEYFVASDCVLTQSGYGKVIELSALGIPFIAIPLEYHFEQEDVMAHRLNHYGTGKLMALRDCSPQQIAQEAKELMKRPTQRIAVDNGTEVGTIILETAYKSRTRQ
jgi:hypothetical protein